MNSWHPPNTICLLYSKWCTHIPNMWSVQASLEILYLVDKVGVTNIYIHTHSHIHTLTWLQRLLFHQTQKWYITTPASKVKQNIATAFIERRMPLRDLKLLKGCTCSSQSDSRYWPPLVRQWDRVWLSLSFKHSNWDLSIWSRRSIWREENKTTDNNDEVWEDVWVVSEGTLSFVCGSHSL